MEIYTVYRLWFSSFTVKNIQLHKHKLFGGRRRKHRIETPISTLIFNEGFCKTTLYFLSPRMLCEYSLVEICPMKMHMEMWKFNNIDDNVKDDNDGQRTNVYLQNCSSPEKLLLTDKCLSEKLTVFSSPRLRWA